MKTLLDVHMGHLDIAYNYMRTFFPAKTQCFLSIVALHIHIGGNGHDAVVVGVLDVVEAVVPVLTDLAVKTDLHGLIRVALQPHLTAGQPVVGALSPAPLRRNARNCSTS